MDYFWEILAYVGIFKVTLLFLAFVYRSLVGKIDISTFDYGWFVVTGATDGIGKSLSKVLSSRGFKVLLISRNEQKLKALAESLKTSNKNIEYIVADFSKSHTNCDDFYSNLSKSISKYPVSCLINNVGVCEYRFFPNQSPSSVEDMLGVNLYPVTFLTHHLLPTFLERFKKSQQKTLIINFSSTIDKLVVPTSAVYSATKTYIDCLSQSLSKEYPDELQVVTVKPGIVATAMSSVKTGNGMETLPLTVSSDEYAESLIRNLRIGVNYGHWKHDLQARVFELLPQSLLNSAIVLFMPIFERLGLVKH
jgi:17beta-estradiol 17-dehydrogenase / very-long-chain 3-oxoacyl-CoA reductase